MRVDEKDEKISKIGGSIQSVKKEDTARQVY